MKQFTVLFSLVLYVVILQNMAKSQELLFKNFARSNRASRAPDDFEKFFLKASKSVPRIGRRKFETTPFTSNKGFRNNFNENRERLLPVFPKVVTDLSWYDLADKVEYYPEILVSPGLYATAGLKNFEDDDFQKDKRENNYEKVEQNKEITEYRLQPES